MCQSEPDRTVLINWYNTLSNKSFSWVLSNSLCDQLYSGITCTQSGYVEEIYFSNQGIEGTFPTEFLSLTYLKKLTFYSNDLRGTIPTEIGQMTSLQELILTFNRFTGSIPTEIGLLTSLQQLSFSNNRLTGSIPTEIGLLKSLQYLFLNDNKLTGSIPSEVGMTSMIYLQLHWNQLTGSIPTEIGKLTSLQDLQLHTNKLTGSIPSEIGKLSFLFQLWSNNNQLTGSIPSDIGQMTSLQSLRLQDNQLNGSFPFEIGFLKNPDIDLRNNKLTGRLPFYSIAFFSNRVYLRGNYFDCSQTGFNLLADGQGIFFDCMNICKVSFANIDESVCEKGNCSPRQNSTYFCDCFAGYSFANNINCIESPPDVTQQENLKEFYDNLDNKGMINWDFNRNLCSQQGITCDENEPRNIISISIANKRCVGTLSSLSKLPYLQELDISFNDFSGTIPLWIQKMTNLQTLKINNNLFLGSIRDYLHQMPKLTLFDASSNKLNGNIPLSILNSNLSTLILRNNYWKCPILDFSQFQTDDYVETFSQCATSCGSTPSQNPCFNDGICERRENSNYFCICKEGFPQPNCNNAANAYCSENSCKNGGKCIQSTNKFICDCTNTNFIGSRCEIDYIALTIFLVSLFMTFFIWMILRYVYPDANNNTFLIICLSVFDYVTDCLFAYNQRNMEYGSEIYYSSVIFLLVPCLFNIAVIVTIFVKDFLSSHEVAEWAKRNIAVFTLTCLISSTNAESFSIIYSRLFYSKALDAPIRQETQNLIHLSGLIGNFLEDIPQLVIQVIVASRKGGFDTFTFLSMIASVTSISFGVLKRLLLMVLFKIQPKKIKSTENPSNIQMIVTY